MCYGVLANAQCNTAVNNINDDFESYSAGSGNPPPTCWTILGASAGGVRTGGNLNPNAVMVYSSVAGSVMYYVTPKLQFNSGTNYVLDFNIVSNNPGAIYDVGTVSGNALSDMSSFVSFTDGTIDTSYSNVKKDKLNPDLSHLYVAIKVTTSAPYTAIRIDEFRWEEESVYCSTAKATEKDNFESYNAGSGLPMPSCWTALNAFAAGVRTDGENNSNCVMLYGFNPGEMYLVSPKLNSFDGIHGASFSVKSSANGVSTFEYGYMTDASNTSTFSPVGPSTSITDSFAKYITNDYPTLSGDNYFVVKFTTIAPHTAVRLDSFEWNLTATLDVNQFQTNEDNKFSLYPNPSNNGYVTLNLNSNTSGNVEVYALNGALVYNKSLPNHDDTVRLDLTRFQAGMYIVKLITNNSTYTRKLMLK